TELRQLTGSSESVAVDGGDHRFTQMPDHQEGIDAFLEMLAPLVWFVLVDLFLSATGNIKAGRKGASGPGEDDDADLLVLLDGTQDMTQVGQHLTTDGIELVRAVQGNVPNPIPLLEENSLIGHSTAPSFHRRVQQQAYAHPVSWERRIIGCSVVRSNRY